MAAILMDGNALRDEIIAGLRVTVEAAGSPPVCLATVLVGNDGPSQRYVASKHKKAVEAGLVARHVDLPETATQGEVEAAVRELTEDASVHGVLVQLPLPDGLDPEPVLDLIPPEKDVDGLTERSMGRLVRNRPGLVGCTPLGVMRLLEKYEVPTSGARAVVIGRSTLVGLHGRHVRCCPRGRHRHRCSRSGRNDYWRHDQARRGRDRCRRLAH
jgi:methylenetetrahydrofolate dehydrogenase (NADP+)/methenyltetrahydrofolate cyclohydrolase